jgi:glycosyltransferase involved in cell wall biosynthesis
VTAGGALGLRILAFCDYFHPGAGGGAERVAREVYRRLAEWGAEVTVVTTAGPAEAWADEAAGLRVLGVPTLDLTPRIGLQASLTVGAMRRALHVAGGLRPHVIHANSLQFQTSVAAARVHRRSGLPMVITAHIGGFGYLPQPWRTLGALHEQTVGRCLLANASRVIAVSEPVATHLRRYRGLEDRIRVVPNGVDHDAFRPAESRPLGNASGVSVLFVGRLVPNKGPDLALEALAELRREGLPVDLTIVGDGPMRPSLERRVRELEVDDAVAFSGFTGDVAERLRAADIFVRPTLTEGMPLAVLEAMASRVCVVASDVPGNASLIRHGESGLLFSAGDVRGLTDALRRVVLDADQRERLARVGHLASQEHSWNRCARETLEVFLETVIDEGRRSAA